MMKYSFLVIILMLLKNAHSNSYLTTCGQKDVEEKHTYNETDYSEIGPPFLYHDVGSVLTLLQKPEHKINTAVQELLKYYHQAKDKKDQSDLAGGFKIHPLIVLEGLSGSGKTTLSNALMKKINGKQIHSPPEAVQILRHSLRNSSELDMAYHALGNYIGGLEVHQMLKDSPVVMDRYWHSYASLAISIAVNNYPEKYEVPSEGHKLYNWPEDLLKPDLVILLNVDEDIREQRLTRRRNLAGKPEKPNSLGQFIKRCPQFLNKMLLTYKRMSNPGVFVMNGNPKADEVLKDIYSKVQPLFKSSL